MSAPVSPEMFRFGGLLEVAGLTRAGQYTASQVAKATGGTLYDSILWWVKLSERFPCRLRWFVWAEGNDAEPALRLDFPAEMPEEWDDWGARVSAVLQVDHDFVVTTRPIETGG